MGVFTYPYYHTGLVGVSPAELKTLHPLDMRALVEAFRELTGVDPLVKGVSAHQIMNARNTAKDGELKATAIATATGVPPDNGETVYLGR